VYECDAERIAPAKSSTTTGGIGSRYEQTERRLSELGVEYRDEPRWFPMNCYRNWGQLGAERAGSRKIVINQMILVGFSCHDAA
jgi:hypothetical protein